MTDTSRRAIEGRFYTDQNLFEAELDRVFARTWQLVGHASQLAEPGDVITATVGRESIVVANADGELCAYYNVCQHRGHKLVSASATQLKAIVCPYHAWVYDLDGQLRRARQIEASALGGICIPRVRIETMAGYLFVNLDPDAAPLAETAPGAEDELLRLAPDAPERVLTARLTHEFAANWKLAIENYNECYHCPNVHRSFSSGVIDPASFMITPKGQIVWHSAVAAPAARLSYPIGEATEYGSIFTWPASSIQCYPGRILNTFRWQPLAVDRTLLIREWWFHHAEPTAAERHIIFLDWNTTVAEDFEILESVQYNMASRGYVPGPLIIDPAGSADVNHENAVLHLQALALQALADVI